MAGSSLHVYYFFDLMSVVITLLLLQNPGIAQETRRGLENPRVIKVLWKIGMLLYHPVTSRPLMFLSRCLFATTPHLTAFHLQFCLPETSRTLKWSTLSHLFNSCRRACGEQLLLSDCFFRFNLDNEHRRSQSDYKHCCCVNYFSSEVAFTIYKSENSRGYSCGSLALVSLLCIKYIFAYLDCFLNSCLLLPGHDYNYRNTSHVNHVCYNQDTFDHDKGQKPAIFKGWQTCTFRTCTFHALERTQTQTFEGPKQFGTSKPGKSNFLGGISWDFAGISRRQPKSLRKKSLCSIFGP